MPYWGEKMGETSRENDIESAWKAIRSLREQQNEHILKTSNRFIQLESWRAHFEKQQSESKILLEKIEKTVESIRDQQLIQSTIEKTNEKYSAKMIAIYSALSSSGATISIGTLAKIMGLI